MAPLPTRTPTIDAIFAKWETRNEPPRPYLGASIIGEPCERKLWYAFRWAAYEIFEGRMLRLFDTGQKEEARVIKDLRDVGVQVWDIDSRTGEQFRVSAIGGHSGGCMDAVAKGFVEAPKTYHCVEIKTHNAKSFAKLQTDGVEKTKPLHFTQVQLYMRWNELERAYYIARNKDDDNLYGERVNYDKAHADAAEAKAERVIYSPAPPPKINENAAWYECTFCPAHSLCHGQRAAPVSCRTCVHATPERDGDARWSCAFHKRDLSVAEQRAACHSHRFIPQLLPYAKPVDASESENWIEYEVTFNKQTKRIRNGTHGPDSYESSELSVAQPSIFFDPQSAIVRADFGARLSAYEENSHA